MYSATEEFIKWLTAKGYTVYSHPPKTGTEFYTVERTGGTVIDLVDHPTFAVQAWADSIDKAEKMSLDVRNLLVTGDMPKGFCKCQVDTCYPWYDENTRLPRYQLVLNCTTQLTIEDS
jgi:hypothetical protein